MCSYVLPLLPLLILYIGSWYSIDTMLFTFTTQLFLRDFFVYVLLSICLLLSSSERGCTSAAAAAQLGQIEKTHKKLYLKNQKIVLASLTHFYKNCIPSHRWKQKLCKFAENCLRKFVKPQCVILFSGGFY